MEFSPDESEFYELNASRKRARAIMIRFNEEHHIPNYDAIRASEFLENKMLAHAFWPTWAKANREEAHEILNRAVIREKLDREKAEKKDAEKPREAGRDRDRDREP